MAEDRDKKERDPRDVLAGENLAILRGDVSQAALAERMRERGWKWSQATVWAIEKGDRPLRLAEAVDVLDVLRAGVGGLEYKLLRPSSTALLANYGRQASDAWHEIVRAVIAFREAQFQLMGIYSQVREEGVQLRTGDLGIVDSWLAEGAAEGAVAEANRRWNDQREDRDPSSRVADFMGIETPMLVAYKPGSDDDDDANP